MKSRKAVNLELVEVIAENSRSAAITEALLNRVLGERNWSLTRGKNHIMFYFWATPKEHQTIMELLYKQEMGDIDAEYQDLLSEELR